MAQGCAVLGIDLQGADICADLATSAGRKSAIEEVMSMASTGLDGLVVCAGLGPHTPDRSRIIRVNYFGAVALVEGLLPLLARKDGAVVAVVSNSAPLYGDKESFTQALLAGEEETACRISQTIDATSVYPGTKNALARWVRKQAPEYIEQGIRINAVAPGMTQTPMLKSLYSDATYGEIMREFGKTIPGDIEGRPEGVAGVIAWLLDGKSAGYVNGNIIYLDNGQDALFRPDSL